MSSSTRIVLAATALHAVVGALIATAVRGPLLAVDDIAFLSMGRMLAGGGEAPIGAQPPYGVLYSVLLAPGWVVGLGESQMIVYAQVLNAVLGALLLPVLYLLVRRLTEASLPMVLGAAAMGASLPAAMLTGSIVWTERLLPLLVAVAVQAVLSLVDEPTGGRLAIVVGVAVSLYTTHPRMGVVTLVLVVSAAVVCVRAGRLAPAAMAAAVGGLSIPVVELVRGAVANATFAGTGTYDGSDLASRRGLDAVGDMAIHAVGTVAYLLLATAGLVVLGAMVLVRHRVVAATYLGMIVAVVAVAGWFLTGVDRSDAYLHGRYIEVMAPLLVALGVVAARELPRRLTNRLVVGGVVVAGLYGAWAGPGDNWARPRSPVMMLGTEVSGAPFGGDFFEPGAAASVAVVVGLAIVAAARRRTWAAPAVAAPLIAVAVLSGIAALDSLQEGSVVGHVQVALAGQRIDELVIDTERVPGNIAAAVAWEVGLDHASREIGIDTTHLLLPGDARPPPGATAVAELGSTTLWAL